MKKTASITYVNPVERFTAAKKALIIRASMPKWKSDPNIADRGLKLLKLISCNSS